MNAIFYIVRRPPSHDVPSLLPLALAHYRCRPQRCRRRRRPQVLFIRWSEYGCEYGRFIA